MVTARARALATKMVNPALIITIVPYAILSVGGLEYVPSGETWIIYNYE